MDVRRQFRNAAEKLRLDFETSGDAAHQGGKGANREDLVRSYLSSLLPSKYSLGAGEVVSSEALRSKQIDIVIYDGTRAPRLMVDPEHGLYPIEVVYGGIEVKSRLDAAELRKSYANLRSLKALAPSKGFTHSPTPMMRLGAGPAMPVCVVIGFSAGRSIEAVKNQVIELDRQLPDLKLRPDAVVLLGEGDEVGIVGPRRRWRTQNNSFIERDPVDLQTLSRTGKNTWLRFYLGLLDELDAVLLPPLDLRKYLAMPERVDGHRVSGHDRFMKRHPDGSLSGAPQKLSSTAIRKVLAACPPGSSVSRLQAHRMQFGNIPISGLDAAAFDGEEVFVYNPNSLPPVDLAKLRKDGSSSSPWFQPAWIQIDNSQYAIDVSSFGEDDWEDLKGIELDELFY